VSSRRLRGGAPEARSGGQAPGDTTTPVASATAPAQPAVPPQAGRVVEGRAAGRGSAAVPPADRPGLGEPAWIRWSLIGIVAAFFALFLVLPLVVVFHEAFRQGLAVYLRALVDPVAVAAIQLTLVAAGIALVLNTVFGVAAAWTVTRFRFPGKSILLTLIDLPFAVSPVIAGLVFILIFGAQGWAGNQPLAFLWPGIFALLLLVGGIAAAVSGWRLVRRRRPGWLAPAIAVTAPAAALLADGPIAAWLAAGNEVPVIFATPGIVLATAFVTFPFVARELIPVMQSTGQEEEQAALSLGASGWTIFWRITLPNVKWGLLYGLILCNARAMGEFGAVSVVSGHIRGQTNTMPLHIEILFNEYQFAAAFAIASILALLALVTLVAKSLIEWRLAAAGKESP
jgi:sulfate transport system permease protein